MPDETTLEIRKAVLALIWIWNVPSQALILKLVPHQIEQLWNLQEEWPLLAESCRWQWAFDGPIGPLTPSASLFSVPMCCEKPPLPAPLWLPLPWWTEGLWIAGKTVFHPCVLPVWRYYHIKGEVTSIFLNSGAMKAMIKLWTHYPN